jgi:DNA-binding NarL/FixJ family response regulator
VPEFREIRIIYAEDNEETRTETLRYWRETSLRGGADCLVLANGKAFTDGQSALKAILEHSPDVAVLDICLAGSKSGFRIAQELHDIKRDHPALEHIKVLLLSNFAAPLASALAQINSGVYHGLIDKICSYEEIRNAISDVYDNKRFIKTPFYTFTVPEEYEREILMRAVYSDDDIAKGLKKKKAYISSVFRSTCGKLKVSERPAAFLVGLKINLFSLADVLQLWNPGTITIDSVVTKDSRKLFEVWQHLALSDEEIKSKVGFEPSEYVEDTFACLPPSDLPSAVKKARAIFCALHSKILTLNDFCILDDCGQIWKI